MLFSSFATKVFGLDSRLVILNLGIIDDNGGNRQGFGGVK